jgi:hypothetical protein
MPIHNRHDFQAFPTFRRADLRATAFGQRKGCVDEALFFIEHTSFAKLIGDVGRNVPQHRREMAHAAAVLSKLQNAVHRRFQSWCRNEVKPGTGRVLIEVDPRYFRQTEVDDLVDDPIENATPAWLAAPRLIQRACRTDGEARPHVGKAPASRAGLKLAASFGPAGHMELSGACARLQNGFTF